MTLYNGQTERFHLPPPPEWDIRPHGAITKETLDVEGLEIGVVLRNVLSQSECEHFIAAGEQMGLVDVSGSAKYRNMFRVATMGQAVSDTVYQRVRPFLSDTIRVSASTTTIHQDLLGASHGAWEPQGLNPAWRVGKYNAGGHFAPHFDGDYVLSSREKSLQTCMLYLNGGFKGGGTNFISSQQGLFKDAEGRLCAEESNILRRVQPEPGMCIIFHHRVMHEGAALLADDCPKYMMRTEIMYKNVRPDDSESRLTAADEEALLLVKEAERLEADDAMASMELWKRAFKLSPAVRDHFNS